jgi:hypothetical protein
MCKVLYMVYGICKKEIMEVQDEVTMSYRKRPGRVRLEK